eukprot:9947880-Alexandrium_andersonii.AAC.1
MALPHAEGGGSRALRRQGGRANRRNAMPESAQHDCSDRLSPRRAQRCGRQRISGWAGIPKTIPGIGQEHPSATS